MSASDHCSSAAELLVDEDFQGAADEFSSALAEDPLLLKGLTGRSQAYLKLKKYKEALQDANAAIKVDAECELAYFRKGVACFELEEFETAVQAFKKGKGFLDAAGKPEPASRPYLRWVRKCETEIEDESDEEDLEEDSTPAPPAAGGATTEAQPVPPTLLSIAAPAESMKYQHYQTAEGVTLTVMEKNVKPGEVKVDIEAKKLTVTLTRAGADKPVVLVIDLFDSVNPSGSSFKVLGTKIEVKLKKVEAYQWPDLKGSGGTKRVASAAAAGCGDEGGGGAAAAVPARAYASKKDWSSVDKSMQEELEKDKPEGEEALNDLFKSIYGKASEETRRAMNKSMQTSGGTVLSTNWGEVGTADYEKERQAPSGMQWKNWEGEKLPQKDDD
mmetsp:Transcript_34610/g.70691  ORF Transcript_34610/g.70691 Transcript_34610/m.70691 type:complete len:387 (+) Transcript_34610:29-1189(+)